MCIVSRFSCSLFRYIVSLALLTSFTLPHSFATVKIKKDFCQKQRKINVYVQVKVNCVYGTYFLKCKYRL